MTPFHMKVSLDTIRGHIVTINTTLATAAASY